MELPIEYLVIEQVKHHKTKEVLATRKFVSSDSAYKHYKAKPDMAFTPHNELVASGIQVYYKIKVLKGVRQIRKYKKILKGYNGIK